MFKWPRQVPWPNRRRWVPVAALVALALAGATTGVTLALSSSPHPAASPNSSGVVSSRSPSSGLLTPKHMAEVAAWKAGHGGAQLAILTQQLGDVLMSHGARQLLQMRQACGKLASAATAARAAPKIPDAALQRSYEKALTEIVKAATDCRAGISARQQGVEDVAARENRSILNYAMSEFAAGAKELYYATEKISTLKHH